MSSPPLSPTTPPSLSEDVSSLIAREMLQLSFQERQQVLHEIHGVDETIQHQEEDIDMVLHAIDCLNEELDNILSSATAATRSTSASDALSAATFLWTPSSTAGDTGTSAVRVTPPTASSSKSSSGGGASVAQHELIQDQHSGNIDSSLDKDENNNDAILEALRHSSHYVRNPSFLRMFLRADKFDSKLAAQRMINFFREKRRLFGSHTLGRDITLSDMDDDDMTMLQSGYTQILPLRDRAGRAVWFSLSHKRRGRSLRSVVSTNRCICLTLCLCLLGFCSLLANGSPLLLSIPYLLQM